MTGFHSLAVGVTLLALSATAASAATITLQVPTSLGQGADSDVRSGSFANDVRGARGSMQVKRNYPGCGGNVCDGDHKGFLRFDVAQALADIGGGTVISIDRLRMNGGDGTAPANFDFWSLSESEDDWNEATITWNTHPAFVNNTRSMGSGATNLGRSHNVTQVGGVDTVFTFADFSSGADDFLNHYTADSDGVISYAMTRNTQMTDGSSWATKENTDGYIAPTLELTVQVSNAAPTIALTPGTLDAGGLSGSAALIDDGNFALNNLTPGSEVVTAALTAGSATLASASDIEAARSLTGGLSLPQAIAAGLANTRGALELSATASDGEAAAEPASQLVTYANAAPALVPDSAAQSLTGSYGSAMLSLSAEIEDLDLAGNAHVADPLTAAFEGVEWRFWAYAEGADPATGRLLDGGLEIGSGTDFSVAYTGTGMFAILQDFGGPGRYTVALQARDGVAEAMDQGFATLTSFSVELAAVPTPVVALFLLPALALMWRPA